jgi:uncharacterized protein (TIGR02301 family)
MRAAALALAATLAAASPAAAQSPPTQDHKELLRLAELLGALHYLGPLCGAKDSTSWRTRMAELMAAEGNEASLRELLAGAFNRGYGTFRESYRVCTPRAHLLTQRYLDEGARLADDLARAGGG